MDPIQIFQVIRGIYPRLFRSFGEVSADGHMSFEEASRVFKLEVITLNILKKNVQLQLRFSQGETYKFLSLDHNGVPYIRLIIRLDEWNVKVIDVLFGSEEEWSNMGRE